MKFLLAIPILGSIINALAIVAGATLGYLLRTYIPSGVMKLPAQFLGLFCLFFV